MDIVVVNAQLMSALTAQLVAAERYVPIATLTERIAALLPAPEVVPRRHF